GLPVVALPFSTDQFAVAADLVAAGLGAALDPNRATPNDLAAAVRASLAPGPRGRATTLGRELRNDPGAPRAARILLDTRAGALGSGPRSAGRQTRAG
ncbi:MAG TPA: hypothetical protein VFL61_15150, partial [Gaiellaceae bacterium]|nr:hypothetical protein [Gaiellaceae bacterium]